MKPICLLTLMLLLISAVNAEDLPDGQLQDPFSIALEDILQTDINDYTAAARKPQKVFTNPSAIFVLSSKDIENSTATTLPDLLRIIPGVRVARLTSNLWDIEIRGFGGFALTKVILLIDGRNTYNTLLSGILWDINDIPLSDIERIELVRGPGAVLWGLNAMNGIINVVTKNTKNTIGHKSTVGAGTLERFEITERYGWNFGDYGSARVYGSYNSHDKLKGRDGTDANGSWDVARFGFRTDTNSDNSTFTMQGDFYAMKGTSRGLLYNADDSPPLRTKDTRQDATGANLLARWFSRVADGNDIRVQTYYEYLNRKSPIEGLEKQHIFDFDFQQNLTASSHNFLWGAGLRLSDDSFDGNQQLTYSQRAQTYTNLNFFVQDQIQITEQFEFTPGIKISHNGFSGIEYQPALKLGYQQNEDLFIWSGISRALRLQSRFERSAVFNPPTPGDFAVIAPVFQIRGNKDLNPEEVLSYELGLRLKTGDKAELDIALFYSDYDELILGLPEFIELEQLGPNIAIPVIPTPLGNLGKGYARGIEILYRGNIYQNWMLQANYSFLDTNVSADGLAIQLDSPGARHMANIYSRLQINERLTLANTIRYVAAVIPFGSEPADSYVQTDFTLNWQILSGTTLSFTGQNLINSDQVEALDRGLGYRSPQNPTSFFVSARRSW